jgi:O-antigen/teichoic acid export membrane protein
MKLWLLKQEKRFLQGGTLGARFARGTFWMLFSSVMVNFIAMIVSIITARLLGKVRFGELGMINSTIAVFSILASLGVGTAAIKYVSQWRHSDPARTGRFIGLLIKVSVASGFIVMLAVFLMGPFFASHLINAVQLTNPLRLSCLLLFFGTVNGAMSGCLAGLEAFKKLAQVSIMQNIINFFAMITLVWMFGLPGAITALVIVSFATLLLYYVTLTNQCNSLNIPITFTNSWQDISLLSKFSLPLFIASMLASPTVWVLNTLLVRQHNGFADMGLINAANQWRIGILTLPSIFCSAALPILSSEQDKVDSGPTQFKIMMDMVEKLAILAVLPLYTFVIFFGDTIMRLYGKNFVNGYPVLLGLSCAAGIIALVGPLGTALAAIGRNWIGLAINLIWAIVLIAVSYIAIPRGGAISYSYCYAGAALLLFVMNSWYMKPLLFPITLYRMIIAATYIITLTLVCRALSSSARLLVAAPMILASVLTAIMLLGKITRTNIVIRIRDIGVISS